MLNIKKCDRCGCSDWICICAKLDKFFKECDSLKPYTEDRPKAKVYDLASFRLKKEKKKII